MSLPIVNLGFNNIEKHTFKIYNIDEVLQNIKVETEVDVDKTHVVIKEVEYTKVSFKYRIKDSKKHHAFRRTIHSLVYLNPGVNINYLFSYLVYINNTHTSKKMDFGRLVDLFKSTYNYIINNKNYVYDTRIKRIHFSPLTEFDGKTKLKVACKLNGAIRSNNSLKKILEAKEYLKENNMKVNIKSIQSYTKLGISTVKKWYRKTELIDTDELSELINNC